MQPRCSTCWTTWNLAKCSSRTVQTCCAFFTATDMTVVVGIAGTQRGATGYQAWLLSLDPESGHTQLDSDPQRLQTLAAAGVTLGWCSRDGSLGLHSLGDRTTD